MEIAAAAVDKSQDETIGSALNAQAVRNDARAEKASDHVRGGGSPLDPSRNDTDHMLMTGGNSQTPMLRTSGIVDDDIPDDIEELLAAQQAELRAEKRKAFEDYQSVKRTIERLRRYRRNDSLPHRSHTGITVASQGNRVETGSVRDREHSDDEGSEAEDIHRADGFHAERGSHCGREAHGAPSPIDALSVEEYRRLERGLLPDEFITSRGTYGHRDYIVERLRPELHKVVMEREKNMDVSKFVTYNGSNREAYDAFIRTCEKVFEAKLHTYGSHTSRVETASSWLRSIPMEAWDRNVADGYNLCPKRWDKFVIWLATQLTSPQQAHIDAFRDLQGLRLKPNESIMELYNRMCGLEKHLAEKRTERSRMDSLTVAMMEKDFKLHEHFVNQRGSTEPTTVSEWLDIAQRAEHMLQRGKHGNSSHTNNANSSKHEHREHRNKGNKEEHRGSNSRAPSGSSYRQKGPSSGTTAGANTCWNCSAVDHMANDPACPKHAEWLAKKAKQASEGPNGARQASQSARGGRGGRVGHDSRRSYKATERTSRGASPAQAKND